METVINELMVEMKAIRRDMKKIRQYIEDPTGEKAQQRTANNGFNKPMNVTPELAAIFKIPSGEKVSRTQVTKMVKAYVDEHKLKNGKEIVMDDGLRALLTPDETIPVTYMNLQRYLKRHYLKDDEVATVDEPTPTTKPRVVKKA
jgi:upstream activation factor subunit UAF30